MVRNLNMFKGGRENVNVNVFDVTERNGAGSLDDREREGDTEGDKRVVRYGEVIS